MGAETGSSSFNQIVSLVYSSKIALTTTVQLCTNVCLILSKGHIHASRSGYKCWTEVDFIGWMCRSTMVQILDWNKYMYM